MENYAPSGFMRLDAVLKVLAISRSSFLAGVKRGKYPQSFRLSPRTVAWKTADIQRLIDQITSGQSGA